MGLSDIFNFIQIDNLIATAGQPTADQFRLARGEGYEIVVNLAPDGLETSLPGQRQLLEGLGIEYHHIPVAWTEPRLDQLAAFERAMDAAGGRRRLIHCQANYRVTSFFALHAEARLGWSRQQADALIDRVWKSRPGYEMDAAWAGFIAAARRQAAG